jgi:hypothetical protein
MSKRFACYTLALSLLLLVGIQKANADATFSSSYVSCSTFTATGTVTTPFVAVRVWNLTRGQFEGGPALIDSFFNVGAPTAYFPAPGGNFSFTASFPVQTTGDTIRARIYAAPAATFGSWDGGTFPQVDVACQPATAAIPTLSGWMLALLAIVLGAASMRAVVRRRRV